MNIPIQFLLLPIIGIVLTFIRCTPPVSGSEVPNERAIVYLPGGKNVAAFAKVQLIPVDYIPKSTQGSTESFLETYTDTNGRYSFPEVANGFYNITARKDSLASFMDSIYINSDSSLPADTLGSISSFCGQIRLQPNHDPRTVIIQVLGTTIYYANVDSSGNFTLPDMAAGKYQLRLETSISGYTPTFYTIRIPVTDTVKPVIPIIYTGIPVVSGLKAVFNPLTAVITVSWHPVNYPYLSNYILYRDDPRNVTTVPTSHASVSDTVFHDSLTNLRTDTKTTIQYRYRVAVQNRSLTIGEFFGHTDCKAILSTQPPVLVQNDTISFVPGDEFTIHVENPEELGEINEYSLDIGPTGIFSSFKGPDTILTIHAPGDTIIPDLLCIIKVRTTENLTVTDSIHLQSQFAWVKLSETPLPNTAGFSSVILNNKIFLFTESGMKNKISSCMVWSSIDGIQWIKVSDSLPFTELNRPPLAFNNQLIVLERDTTKQHAVIWFSANGRDWQQKTIDSLPNQGYLSEFEVWSPFKEKLLCLNYNPPCHDKVTCEIPYSWSSTDGINWNTVSIKNSVLSDKFDTPNRHFVACEYNGALVMAGAWRALSLIYPVWSSYAIRIWPTLESNPVQIQFPAPAFVNYIQEYNPSLIVYKNKLFLSAQINMENSVDIASNTRYLWTLLPENRWYLCSRSFPATNNSAMKSNFHTLCVREDKLISIGNTGVWTIKK